MIEIAETESQTWFALFTDLRPHEDGPEEYRVGAASLDDAVEGYAMRRNARAEHMAEHDWFEEPPGNLYAVADGEPADVIVRPATPFEDADGFEDFTISDEVVGRYVWRHE